MNAFGFAEHQKTTAVLDTLLVCFEEADTYYELNEYYSAYYSSYFSSKSSQRAA